jgi:hypothetical protein
VVASATAGLSWNWLDACHAQESWQPTRQANDQWQQTSPQGLKSTLHQPTSDRPVLSSTERVGAGVVLRWQSTAPREGQSANPTEMRSARMASSNSTVIQPVSIGGSAGSANQQQVSSLARIPAQVGHPATEVAAENPLRIPSQQSRNTEAVVRTVAYQQGAYERNPQSTPNWRSASARQEQDSQSGANPLPDFPAPRVAPQGNPLDLSNQALPPDNPLSELPNTLRNQTELPEVIGDAIPSLGNSESPEPAPQPPQIQEGAPSFPPQSKDDRSPRDLELVDPPKPLNGLASPPKIPARDPAKNQDSASDMSDEEFDRLLQRSRKSSLPSCISQRDMLRGKPLSAISLDVSPKLSDGLDSLQRERDSEQSGKSRKEFESKSMLRDWTDYKGDFLVTGRMIDMKLGNIVIDVDGTERMIPPSQLSDVDMTYVAELWNLPFRCGTGYEPRVGRDFVESTVQWKASGACHNPLYFEQVQLERYGHDAGPIVQPLISSAHFFLTLPMLPYKMGINPPNECQYALGYIRPGNCAPYMVQPFPWSLRGGLVQAGAVVGAAAILP